MNWIRQHTFWMLGLSILLTAIMVMLAMSLGRSDKTVPRRLTHRFTVADPQLRREISVMLGPTITTGNQVTALHNRAEIFPAMLAAIRAARHSVTFETYIYWSGAIGK